MEDRAIIASRMVRNFVAGLYPTMDEDQHVLARFSILYVADCLKAEDGGHNLPSSITGVEWTADQKLNPVPAEELLNLTEEDESACSASELPKVVKAVLDRVMMSYRSAGHNEFVRFARQHSPLLVADEDGYLNLSVYYTMSDKPLIGKLPVGQIIPLVLRK